MNFLNNIDSETYHSFSPVEIRDEKGNYFFYHPNKKKGMFFNLPKGVFYSSNEIMNVDKRYYPLFDLPKEEHHYDHKGIKVIEKKNPCKATIYPDKKIIKVDTKLSDISYTPALVFVMAHEFGHLRYKTESYCDLFSCNFMLLKGYNPSQIKSCYLGLFKNNPDRKGFLDNQFNKKNFIL